MSWSKPIPFLRKHEGEWWTPNEIAKAMKSDIRTTKNRINANRHRLYYTTYEGWRLDVAERGKRIYAVRLMQDVEGSRAKINAEIAEAQGLPEENLEDIVSHKDLILKHARSRATRDAFLRYLDKTQLNPHSDIGLNNHVKLTQTIQNLKKYELDSLNEYLAKLVS
jgi:hypothetical protein